MTTYYLDFEGGNDGNAGTSFALRKKTIAGFTAAILAPGDTVRCMASPAPTSLGVNGTWTDGPRSAAVALVSSTNATPIVARVSTANYTLLGLAVGDTVSIVSHTTNTNANGLWMVSALDGVDDITLVNANGTNSVGNGVGGATGTIRKVTNTVVKLASALTKNVALCGNSGQKPNWTSLGGANVVCSVTSAAYKEGVSAQQIAVGAGFATGGAAYFATGTLDLSAYQQISFWIQQPSGTVAIAGDVKMQLCTDAVGAVAVHDLAIPALGDARWRRITVDLGTNLNAAIASINFTVNVDRGAQTFIIDNIIACKASSGNDALTLTSLIGKNTGTETFCAIQSINDVRVVLAGFQQEFANTQPGYAGVTETVTAYKRETIKLAPATASLNLVDNGTSGSLITYSGGWNRTDMSTQTDETWLDGQSGGLAGGNPSGWSFVSRTFNKLEKFGGVNFNKGVFFNTSSNDNEISACHFNNNTTQGIVNQGGIRNTFSVRSCSYNETEGFQLIGFAETGATAAYKNALSGDHFDGNGSNGILASSSSVQNKNFILGDIGSACCNAQNGISPTSARPLIGTVTRASGNGVIGVDLVLSHYAQVKAILEANKNGTHGLGVSRATEVFIGEYHSANNGTASILQATAPLTGGSASCYIRRATMAESVKVSGQVGRCYERVFVERLDDVVDAHKTYWDTGTVTAQTVVRHTASGIAWQLSPTSADCDVWYPLDVSLAKIAVQANKICTIKCWARRDSTSLTLTMRLRGGQLSGVLADVTAVASAAINTWEELSLSFTPTEQGVIEVIGEAYGGTTLNGYFDDFSAAQAGRLIRSTLNNAWHGQPFAPVGPNSVGSMFLVFP